MMRVWRGERDGEPKNRRKRPSAKYSPSQNEDQLKPDSLRAPGEVLEPSCASGSLGGGTTQEPSQKADLFSSETIAMFQRHHFVKCQTDPLGPFIITSVGSLVKNKHTKQALFFCSGLHSSSNLCPG